MLGLIGVKKDIDISIREKFSIKITKKLGKIEKLLEEFKEVVVLDTCNRTEIYFDYHSDTQEVINKVFEILEWDEVLKQHTFFKNEESTIKHLFEVSCGYHSKIKGEDQILGQIKTAYKESLDIKGTSKVLGRLFESAIACGKKFRNEAKLYEIPVSSISIVANKFIEMNCKKIMILGFGEIGQLAVKYFLQDQFEEIYIVLRDLSKAADLEDTKIKILTFEEKNKYINEVDGIIGCTSAPHAVVFKEDLNEIGNKLYCFDMAIPRDIDKNVLELERVESYNIDEISKIDDENKILRAEKMKEYRYLIDDAIEEYKEWIKIRNISNKIREIKENGYEIYKRRLKTFNNKKNGSEDDNKLVGVLLKSTSDVYINRAIELLKEEKLKGCERECLRIINRIFAAEN